MPFCKECGNEINEKAAVCLKCGVATGINNSNTPNDQWIITLALCLFLGVFGVHRFYNGHVGIGVVQLLTFGGCGIWALIDLILIATEKFKDYDGNIIQR